MIWPPKTIGFLHACRRAQTLSHVKNSSNSIHGYGQYLGSKIRQNPNFAFSCLFSTNLTQDYGQTHGWNLMNLLHVKESELAYVHAENQCIWMVFGGQINSIYWFSWISVQYLGLKKTREIWLADFCHFLEKYTSEFNKNWDLAINS